MREIKQAGRPQAGKPAGRQARILPCWLSGFLACSSPAGLFALLLVVTSFHTQIHAAPLLSTNLPPSSPLLPDASFSVIRVFGALALVVGLFLAGVWLFKNWQRLALQRGRPSQLQILEMKALGHKHALYVVGYQQQRLLLASSPAGIALVSHLPVADTTEVEPTKLAGENFVQVLQQAVQAKA
jgi:flagellar biogenesis protein FliO